MVATLASYGAGNEGLEVQFQVRPVSPGMMK